MNTLYPDIEGLNQTMPREKAAAPAPAMLSPPNQQLSTPKSSPEWPSRLSPESESPSDQILACHWEGCSNVFDDAETLYTHLCDDHVGRKSTRNLTLTCKWDNCDVTTAKRDHITSHIRIHIPLKPYKCNLCTKSFKRPQDLKKHARTHQSDTLPPGYRYTETDRSSMNQRTSGYNPAAAAAPIAAPLPPSAHVGYGSGQYNGYAASIPMDPYGGAPAPIYGNYGPSPYYGNDTLSGMVRSTQPYEESRKRAFDMTYDLIADVKRARVTPDYSQSMAHRINAMSALVQGPAPTAQNINRLASLPARDLSSADDFLNQLSMNMSRNSDLFGYSPPGAAATGVTPSASNTSSTSSLTSANTPATVASSTGNTPASAGEQQSLYPTLPWEKQQGLHVPRFDHEATSRRMVVGTQRAAPTDLAKETPREVYEDNTLSDDEDAEQPPSPVPAAVSPPKSPVSEKAQSPESTRDDALNALRVISVLRNMISQAVEAKRKQESEEKLYPAVEVQ